MSILSEQETSSDFETSTVFTAITHNRYGEPGEVLVASEFKAETLQPRSRDVVVRVSKRPIHPGDLHIIRALAKGGPSTPISTDTGTDLGRYGLPMGRVPGFEGVGVIERFGSDANRENKLAIRQRVAFFHPKAASWSSLTVVPSEALVPVPDDVPDEIAAQMLVNTITARIVLRAGHNSLPPDFELPVYILQTAAGSAVGMLISRLAMDLGVKPIRLVRFGERARTLEAVLPGSPVIATEDRDWKAQVKVAFEDRPLQVVIDSIGGSFLNEVASLMDYGGAIVNFGWLGEGVPDLTGFAPNGLSLRGVSIGGWIQSTTAELRASDIKAALRLAQKFPELFPVAADYSLSDFQQAISHVEKPKVGTVILSS